MEVAAVVLWWALCVGLFGTGLPLAAWILPDTADHGAFLAFPIAILALILPVYWAGQLVYGMWTVFLGLGVLIGISILLRRNGCEPHRERALELVAVFTAAFFFFLAIRSVDPAAHPGGGEKFLDLGLVQSLLRAESLPPQDMWFAGERVVYYYGGHLVAATLALLTGIPGRLTYNLALITAYAGGVSVVYGFTADIAAARDLPRRLAGGIGGVFFGLASNLFTTAGLVGTVLGGGLLAHLASATGRTVEQARVTVDSFGYWWASRVISGTVTEFPFFAYLNGDLHAHMTDTTILLLVAAVGFAYYRTPRSQRWRRRALIFGVAPPAIGFLTVVNTWSLPAGVGLIWLALLFAPAPPWDLVVRGGTLPDTGDRPVRDEVGRLAVSTLLAVVLLGLSLAWVAPYVFNVLLPGDSVNGIGVVPDRTGLWALLVAHGTFLVSFGWYLLGFGLHRTPRMAVAGGLLIVGGIVGVLFEAPVLLVVVPLATCAWFLLGVGRRNDATGLPGYETVLLIAGAGLVTIVEFVFLNDAASGGRYNTVFKVYAQVWPLWSIAGGVALTAAISGAPRDRVVVLGRQLRSVLGALIVASSLTYAVFALVEHFKPYVDVWWSWSSENWVLIAAVLLVAAGGWVFTHLDDGGGHPWAQRLVTELRLRPVLAVVLVAALALNGAVALADDEAAVPAYEPSVDAVEFIHVWHAGEAPAIEWLLARPGQPHIVSAPGFGVYGWASEASSLTGLPTVIGWSHEANYRSQEAFFSRVEDVDALYRGTPGERAAILRKYDVAYIYVGPNERERYSQTELDFADEPGISVAIEAGAATVYAVDQSALALVNGTAQTAMSPARLTTSRSSASMDSTSRKWGMKLRFS